MDSTDDLDAALDARLRAAFAPPRDVKRMAREILAQSGAIQPVSRWRHLRSAAAILVAVAGFGWFASRGVISPAGWVPIDAGQFHAQISAELGAPASCHSPEEELNQVVTRIVGTQLDYRGEARVPLQGPFALPEDWDGDPAAIALAGHINGGVVVVVIQRADLATGRSFDPSGRNLVHRRELGEYVLHEISSSKAPACLDEFAQGSVE